MPCSVNLQSDFLLMGGAVFPPCCLTWAKLNFVVVFQWLNPIWYFVTPWTAASQTSWSFTISGAHTDVYWVGDAIQPSYPLLPSSPLALSLSQHQGFFQRVSSTHQVLYWPRKVLHQTTGASASISIFPMNTQDWFPLGLTGLILLSKGLSRVFSSHQFFSTQLSLWSSSHTCTWLLEKPKFWP